LKFLGGAAVLLGSFWLSLQVIDLWSLPPNAAEIRILEASYGSIVVISGWLPGRSIA